MTLREIFEGHEHYMSWLEGKMPQHPVPTSDMLDSWSAADAVKARVLEVLGPDVTPEVREAVKSL